MAILRLPAVKVETGHRSHASIYNAVNAGLFTQPVLLGRRAVGWPADEVLAINTARIAGSSDEQIRELVKALHAQRMTRLDGLAHLWKGQEAANGQG